MLEIDSLKRPIINSEIEFVIKKKKNLPAKKKSRAGGLPQWSGG